jgi:RNA polymerase sigma-70 factor (ECF subfamily)
MSAILTRALSDERLVHRATSGDGPAFDELYRRYKPRLAVYAGRILGDSQAGEDAAQVALFNAYRALKRGTEPGNLQGWLYRITRNAAYELARRRKDEVLAAGADELIGEADEASGIRAELMAGLRDLPDRQRRTFVLRELHGCSTAEVAERLGITVPQVEQALFAARNRLAERLVFGHRPDCATYRSLDPRSLDRSEQRALKAHARSCPTCRKTAGRRVAGLALLPVGVLASARDVGAALLGGFGAGAPVVAKVGAAVVTAAVATAVPAAVPSRGEAKAPGTAAPVSTAVPAPPVAEAPGVEAGPPVPASEQPDAEATPPQQVEAAAPPPPPAAEPAAEAPPPPADTGAAPDTGMPEPAAPPPPADEAAPPADPALSSDAPDQAVPSSPCEDMACGTAAATAS